MRDRNRQNEPGLPDSSARDRMDLPGSDSVTESSGCVCDPAVSERVEAILAGASSLPSSKSPVINALNTLGHGVMVCDHNDRVAYVNEALVSLLGIPDSDLIGRPVREAFNLAPDECDAYCTTEVFTWEHQGGKPYVIRIVRPGGAVRCLQACSNALRDDAGALVGRLMTIMDITVHCETVKALQRSRELYKAHYEDSPLAYQSLDRAGRLIEINPAWTELLGYEPGEVLGRSFGDFMTAEYVALFPDLFRRFLEVGRVHEVEFELVRRDGSTRIVHVNGRLQMDQEGNVQRTHCILHDMTHRIEAERRLRESEARYRAVVENQTELICRFDSSCFITFVNDRMCQQVGRARDALIGAPLEAISGSGLAVEARSIMASLVGVEDAVQSELQMTLPSGELRWYQWTCRAIRDNHGHITEYQCVGSDMTARKLAEIELQRRERYMSGLAEGLQCLLPSTEELDYDAFLASIGFASRASRAYYFRKHRGEDGRMLVSQRAEWCAAGIKSQVGNPMLRNIPVYPDFEQWEYELSAGRVINGSIDEFGEVEQAFLASQDVRSVLVIPLMIDEEAVGFIGFDDCISTQRWEPSEVSFLQAAAGGLAHALKRSQAEQELRVRERESQELAESRQRLLSEVDHRAKNNLASLDALIDLIQSKSVSMDQFAESLRRRLHVMGVVHRLLAGAQWNSAPFTTLIHYVIRQFEEDVLGERRIRLNGGPLSVVPRQATALAMIFHELLTNSQRHGVLQPGKDGRVEISWQVLSRNDSAVNVRFTYREAGSDQEEHAIEGADMPGIGLELINGFATFELQGSYHGEFVPREGFAGTIEACLAVK